MSYDKDRNYLHPIKLSYNKSINHQDYRTVQSGQYNGTILTRFTSQTDKTNPRLRHGIMVEKPNEAPVKVFGTFNDIEEIGQALKRDPAKVAASLRPVGNSTGHTFFLNEPPLVDRPDNPDYVVSKTDQVYDPIDVLQTVQETEQAALGKHVETLKHESLL